MTNLLVELKHTPNPDVGGGYWTNPVDSGMRRLVPVASFAQASKLCVDFIERNELGGGNWSGGRIYQTLAQGKKGAKVGYVSYGGQVFDNEELKTVLYTPPPCSRAVNLPTFVTPVAPAAETWHVSRNATAEDNPEYTIFDDSKGSPGGERVAIVCGPNAKINAARIAALPDLEAALKRVTDRLRLVLEGLNSTEAQEFAAARLATHPDLLAAQAAQAKAQEVK